jgi:PAS domain S-box-containing protein
MYGSYSTLVGAGIVGGRMFKIEDVGRQAAGLVQKILDGKKLTQADMPPAVPSQYLVDWKQLQRWHLSEARLPPGTIVLYRELSPWQRYKQYIIGGLSLVLVEMGLILGLLWQRAKRRKVETNLAISNERVRLAVEAGKSVGWEWDLKTGRDFWFGDLQTMFGLPSDTFVGRVEDFYRYVHPEDREVVAKAVADAKQGRKPYAAEFRVVRLDGTVRWVAATGKFYYGSNGDPERMLGMAADITERKLAEERLREYEKAVEGSEEMIAVVDREYRYLIANRKFLSLRNMTKEQVVGRLAPEVLTKGVFEAVVKDKLDECFRGKVIRYEMKYTYPELGERDVFVSYFPIEGAKGIDRAACILQDITDRKRNEEALRKSEERFRLAAQTGKMYAYEWDVATDMVMRSTENVGVLGFSDQAKHVTRQQLVARVHPDDRALFVGSVDQVTRENPTTHIGYRMSRPDGSVVWLEKNARGFFDEEGKLLRMVGMVADITERKRAEEALQDSEDKLRLLLDSTAESIYGIDLEHHCTFCNRACLRALGYERIDEVLGKNMHELMHHTRPDGTLFPVEECRVHQVIRTGEGVHADDEVLWRANGTSFPAEYWSYPQRKGQEVVGAVVAFVDITEHKLAEAALANVSRRLIEAQEHERTRIARELHDDIGQRLALLTIELERFQEDSPDLPVEAHSRMGELQKQTSEIATDIQTLSHELHSAKLEYLGIAAAMRGFCKEFGEQQNVEIDFKIPDLPSPLSPDISLCLFRVLQEALHNSAKHSGVRHVDVRLWGASDEIHLAVSDSGAGFDNEATKERRGLGLISMEERLKLVKGTLSIESQPKRGTTIHARVPLSSGSDSMRAAG